HASADVERAFTHAREVAERDGDNPHRRFFDTDAGTTREAVAGWNVEGVRVPNPYVSEALWCDVFGLRAQTLQGLSTQLDDDGGYLTTHAVWAEQLARERGCLKHVDSSRLDELRRAQPPEPGPTTRDLDLFAERLVMLRLTGDRSLDDAPLRA